MLNDFDRDVTGALWIARTTEQPAVLVPRPRPTTPFDQLMAGASYPKPPKRAWHPVMHQLIGVLAGVSLTYVLVIWSSR